MLNTKPEVRVRFAPSPTGHLHLGNIRTAVFNYIYAKKYNGKYILRLEDTDLERSTDESAKSIMEDMRWLGLVYDEGPDIGGPYGPYKQSERLQLYKEACDKLIKMDRAYHCFCKGGEIEEGEIQAGEVASRSHMCHCKDLSQNEIETKLQNKEEYALRFKVNPGKTVIEEMVFGRLEKEIEDFIIMKKNGYPTFHLAVVVDDHHMKITHVIRGNDHLDNTFKHAQLIDALGYDRPKWAHSSLTYGLSKRDSSISVKYFRESGYLSEGIINAALLLGWSPKNIDREKFNYEEQIPYFDPADFNKTNSNFDRQKFDWLSQQYIREADLNRLVDIFIPMLEKESKYSHLHFPREKLIMILEAVKGNLVCVKDTLDYMDMFTQDYAKNKTVLEKIQDEKGQSVCKGLQEEIKEFPREDINAQEFIELIKKVQQKTKIKGKELYHPIRIALTGAEEGPELKLLVPILGKTESLKRLNDVIN